MGDPALKKTIIVVVCVFVFFYLLTWGTSSVSNNKYLGWFAEGLNKELRWWLVALLIISSAAELGSQEEESENQEQLTEFEEGWTASTLIF